MAVTHSLYCGYGIGNVKRIAVFFWKEVEYEVKEQMRYNTLHFERLLRKKD
jgi:hypothetical protein